MSAYMVVATFSGKAPFPSGEVPPAATTVWSNIDRPDRSMLVVRYEDRASADDRMRRLVERGAPIPDVRGLTVLDEKGKRLDQLEVGSSLSAAHFVTTLGRGKEVSEAISETISGLSVLPRYSGHSLALNLTLNHEVWLLVAWNGPPPTSSSGVGIVFERFRRVR